MADRPYNVPFLCTGNAARSIVAEPLVNQGDADVGGFIAAQVVGALIAYWLARALFATDRESAAGEVQDVSAGTTRVGARS
jgi:hypothetical protein